MTPTSLAFVLTLCVACEAFSHMSDYNPEEQLYAGIRVADYEDAVSECIKFEKEKMGAITAKVIDRLLGESQRKVIDFAYQLWAKGNKDIVKKYFPEQFRAIIDQSNLKLVNRRDNLALKLDEAQDSANDRTAYGDGKDKTSMNVAWRFIPVWDNDRAYYKIYNVHYDQYLKLGVAEDDAGDHKVYGDYKAETFRHQWYIVPKRYENDLLFFVYNREYNKALKLSRDVNESQDRQAWGHSGHVSGSPELFAWYIIPFY